MLSDKKLRALLKGHDNKNPLEVTDRDGLSVRVRNTGRVSFIYRYRYAGKPVRLTVGQFTGKNDGLTLAEARDRVRQYKTWLADGYDPRVKIATAKSGIMTAFTVRQALSYWNTEHASKNRTNASKHMAQFEKHVFPFVGGLPIDDLTTQMWVKVFKDITKGTHHRPAPVASGYILVNVKHALKYCREHGYCNSRALDDITIKSVAEKQSKKERRLSSSEVFDLWLWCIDTRYSWYYRNMAKLLLIFGARTQEIRLSQVSEWDLNSMIWTCPKAHSKNGEEVRRPIPESLRQYIHDLKCNSATGYLLNELKQAPAVSSYGVMISKKLNHDKWNFHDLRRTVATNLNEIGILPHVVESLLGHSLQGVAGIYNRAEYIPQKLEALTLWLDRLESGDLING